MEGRVREDYRTVSWPVHLGEVTIDVTYPYGDGPYVYPVQHYLDLSPATAYSKCWKCFDETHPGPPYRSGGPVAIHWYKSDQFVPKAEVDVRNGFYRYAGKHIVHYRPSNWLGFSTFDEYIQTSGDDDPSSFGATGWNKFRPTNSSADIGVFIGEFSDMPRMLRNTAKGFSDLWKSMGGSLDFFRRRSLANQWLNIQFGWLPFLSDLRSFYETTKTLDRRMKQLRRDNGRWIRRGGTITTEQSSEVVHESTDGGGLMPMPPTQLFSGSPYGRTQTTYTFEREVWFEGAFRYWIPGKPGSWYWNARAVSMLYGLTPSPSLVWELTPWSWLIDWWSNAGDVIANMSSIHFDGLAAKYAYVMMHTIRKCVTEAQNNYISGPAHMSAFALYETKCRLPASPFGFGLTEADLSLRQWSILSALGLSRSHRW